MKKKVLLRVLLAGMTLAVLAAVMTFTAFAEEQTATNTEPQNGFVTVDDVLYYYENGERVTGWFEADGIQYYASKVNYAVINYDKTIGGKLYLWNDATGLALANGFVETESGTLCYKDGIKVIGWRHADGTGPVVGEDGISEQYSTSPNNLYYFLSTTGYMVTDSTYKLGGYTREFNDDHTVKPLNGFQLRYGILYAFDNGVSLTGWQTDEATGNTYYFQASDAVYGRAASKWMYIGDKLYYFYASTSTPAYAIKTSGTIGGNTYTFGENGQILYTGFINTEYANANNNTSAYIYKMNGTTRYLVNGETQYGWQYIDNTWYYFFPKGSENGSGYMCTGTCVIDGVNYEFSETGACTSRADVPVYSVTYPTTEGVTVSGPDSVNYGETLTFTVTVGDGYKVTSDGLKVFVNGAEISATGGEYVVENVLADVVITVTGVAREPQLYEGYEVVIDKPMAQWPDSNSVEITECDDIPEGYTKAYAFTMGWQWGYRTNLANVDISNYSTVSFKIRALDLQNPALFHLYQGDTYLKNFYYADTSWHEIVLTKDASGAWTMTADGEVVEGFTSTETNLKDVFNFSLGNTTEGCPDSHFQVTQIVGVPLPPSVKDGYEVIIDVPMAQWPDDNSVNVTESDVVPDGYLKAYAFTMGWQWGYRTNLANVDISNYTTVSFMIRALDLESSSLFHLYQGNTYLKNFYYADTSWHEIVLTKDASGAWTMTADGTVVDGFTSTETNLKDVFNFSLGNTTEGCPDAHFQVTQIIGIPIQYEEVISIPMAQWPDSNSVDVTECDDVPEGYTKAYAFTMGWQWGYRTNLANVDISDYSTVSFMIRALDLESSSLFHLYQGDTYLKNFYYADTNWHEIVLTKNSEGAWTMTVDGTVIDGFTSTESNLKDIFNFSLGNTTEGCADSHFHVTNIIGVKA